MLNLKNNTPILKKFALKFGGKLHVNFFSCFYTIKDMRVMPDFYLYISKNNEAEITDKAEYYYHPINCYIQVKTLLKQFI